MEKYWALIASLLFAIIGLRGDTYNKEKQKLTSKGITILILSIFSFLIAVIQQHYENIQAEKQENERIYIASKEGEEVSKELQVFLDIFYLLGRQSPSPFSHINSDSRSNLTKIDTLQKENYWNRISPKNLYKKMWDSTTYYGVFMYNSVQNAKTELEYLSKGTRYLSSQTIAAIYKITSDQGLKSFIDQTKGIQNNIKYQSDLTFYSAIGGIENYKSFIRNIKNLQQLIDTNNL